MEQQRRAGDREETIEAAERSTTDPAILAAVGSVLLAQYQFFMRDNKMMGMFIGLWAPTLLSFASYFNQKRMEEKLRTIGPSRLIDSIEQMISGR